MPRARPSGGCWRWWRSGCFRLPRESRKTGWLRPAALSVADSWVAPATRRFAVRVVEVEPIWAAFVPTNLTVWRVLEVVAIWLFPAATRVEENWLAPATSLFAVRVVEVEPIWAALLATN